MKKPRNDEKVKAFRIPIYENGEIGDPEELAKGWKVTYKGKMKKFAADVETITPVAVLSGDGPVIPPDKRTNTQRNLVAETREEKRRCIWVNQGGVLVQV